MRTVALLVIVLGLLLMLLVLTITGSGDGGAIVLVGGMAYGTWRALRWSLTRP